MPLHTPLPLLFPRDAPAPEIDSTGAAPSHPSQDPAAPAFGDEPELPPTWTEGSLIFHTTEKCTRLQAIRRNRRVSGHPGPAMRPCFNCEDILRAKRRG